MQQQEHDNAELCSNGCGFFGSSASGGMCSVCWKKTLSNRQAQTQSITPTPETVKAKEEEETNSEEQAPKVEIKEEVVKVEEEKPIQKNKKRCWQCKKKVGLTGIECRCKYVFCGLHRYGDQHNCTFDYKSAERMELAKRNPGGGAFDKLEKL